MPAHKTVLICRDEMFARFVRIFTPEVVNGNSSFFNSLILSAGEEVSLGNFFLLLFQTAQKHATVNQPILIDTEKIIDAMIHENETEFKENVRKLFKNVIHKYSEKNREHLRRLIT